MQDENLSELPPLPPLPPRESASASVPVSKKKRGMRCNCDGAETIPKVPPLARRNGRKVAPPPPQPPPLEVPVPFKAETLARANVRAHLVCEAAAHLLYMQQQIPMPWPKCAEMHASTVAQRAADAATLLPGARRQGITSGPARHLAHAATMATQLFDTLHSIFSLSQAGPFGSCGHPLRVALVFGPCPRRAQWVVLLDFSAWGAPFYHIKPNNSSSQTCNSNSSTNCGVSAEDKRVLDATGRRLKRALLEVAMQTPPTRGGTVGGATAQASKLHVLLQFDSEGTKSANDKTDLIPCAIATDNPGSGAFKFDNAAAVLPRSRLPAALVRALNEPFHQKVVDGAAHDLSAVTLTSEAMTAAQQSTSSGRKQRTPKGWPTTPWVVRFGVDDSAACKSRSSAEQPQPELTVSPFPSTHRPANEMSCVSNTSAVPLPVSPTKRQRPPSPATAAKSPNQYEPTKTEAASELASDSSIESDTDNSSEEDCDLENLRQRTGNHSTQEHPTGLSQQPMVSQRSPSNDRAALSPLKPLPELGAQQDISKQGEEQPWFYLHKLVVKGVPHGKSSN